MSGPPPPPPPMSGPPPPPMANFNNVKKLGGSSGGGGDMRGALLSQIQKGTQLKKVTTVDKSKPKAGRVAEPAGKGPSQSSPTRSIGSVKTSPDSSTSSPIRQGGFSNLTDELQYKLTLKKNKNSPLKESKGIVETKESSPPSTTSSSKSFVDEIKSKQSVFSPQHQSSTSTTTSPPHTVSDAIPNRSSLFNHSINNNNVNNINSKDSLESKSQSSAPKINHGKPNLAPRPPPQLSLAMNNNNNVNISNNSLNDGSRKHVARHQSMKSPRSPPVTLASTTGPFNSDNHFGTIRNPSSQNKTQEALNLQVTQKSVAQRPTIKPPPPPVPNRNIGTNLSTQSHAKSTTALNNTHSDTNLSAPPTRRLPNSGSSSNISNMERNVDMIDSTAAPPLPPHRISSAQKAQQRSQQQMLQQQQVINSQVPPEVPRRHSSMRASIDNGSNNMYPSPNPNQKPVTRLVVDLEARYSLLFHSVSEFPAPKPFLNVNKAYPSKSPSANGMGI